MIATEFLCKVEVTLETGDGALIYVNNKGYRHGPQEVIARRAAAVELDFFEVK